MSILRNPIIAGVFYRLNFIEQFGTGVMIIIDESNLSEDEVVIYNILMDELELLIAL